MRLHRKFDFSSFCLASLRPLSEDCFQPLVSKKGRFLCMNHYHTHGSLTPSHVCSMLDLSQAIVTPKLSTVWPNQPHDTDYHRVMRSPFALRPRKSRRQEIPWFYR